VPGSQGRVSLRSGDRLRSAAAVDDAVVKDRARSRAAIPTRAGRILDVPSYRCRADWPRPDCAERFSVCA
jgi:hypothetical protein